jgi:hypothetical protein
MINQTLIDTLIKDLESEHKAISTQLEDIHDNKNKKDLFRQLTYIHNLIKSLYFYKFRYITKVDNKSNNIISIVKKEISKINIKSSLCK